MDESWAGADGAGQKVASSVDKVDKVDKAGHVRVKDLPRDHWEDEAGEQDFTNAADYLSLVLPEPAASSAAAALRVAPLVRHKAIDLLRAGRLPLLPKGDPQVQQELDKVRHGLRLSPILAVRGSISGDVPLTLADGYPRVCASCHIAEDADVPCRIAELPRL